MALPGVRFQDAPRVHVRQVADHGTDPNRLEVADNMKARRFVKLSIATAKALKRIPDLKAEAEEEERLAEIQRLEIEALVRRFQGRRDSRR